MKMEAEFHRHQERAEASRGLRSSSQQRLSSLGVRVRSNAGDDSGVWLLTSSSFEAPSCS